MQFVWQRKANQVVESGNLLKEWNAERLWLFRSGLDVDNDPDVNRVTASVLYSCIVRFGHFRRFLKMEEALNNLLEDTTQSAERMEIYIRKGAANESIIAESAGYSILSTYFFLRDILQHRAGEYDYNYDGFRDLALRVQDYAKMFPLDADLRDELTDADLPPLVYRGGDKSVGYHKSPWRRILLRLLPLYRTVTERFR